MAHAAVERLQQDRAVRHPRRRGSNLSLRRGPRDGNAARPHHRVDPGPAGAPARSRQHAQSRLSGHQGTLPRTAPSRSDRVRTRERSSLRQRQGPMSVQDTPTVGAMARLDRAQPKPEAARPAAVRRLPVQQDWPTWALIAAQIGILVAALSLWELGARSDWTDAFSWSQPR